LKVMLLRLSICNKKPLFIYNGSEYTLKIISMIFNTAWQGGFMQTILRIPLFLILFTIFSISFSVSSATGQTLNLNNFGEVGFVIDEDMVKGCTRYVGQFQRSVPPEDPTLRKCLWIQMKTEDTKGGSKPKPTLPITLTSSVVERPNGSYIPDSIRFLCKQEDFMAGPMGRQTKPDCDLIAAADGGTTPPPVNPPGVPPVINGSYEQQLEEVQRLDAEVQAAFRDGRFEEGQKIQKEVSLLRDATILGELKRGAETNSLPVVQGSYQNHLGYAQDLNLRVSAQGPGFGNIQGFSSPFIAADSAKNWAVEIERKKQAGGTLPPGGPPSDDPVEAAKQAKVLAEQNVTTATTELDEAKAARLAAEQKLADAKTALEKAEQAFKDAKDSQAKELQVAEQAVEDAKQKLTTAQTALDTANNKLRELEQQLTSAKTKVTEAETTQRGARQAVLIAKNKIRKVEGKPPLPPIDGLSPGTPPPIDGGYQGPPGSTPPDDISAGLRPEDWGCKTSSGEPGTLVNSPGNLLDGHCIQFFLLDPYQGRGNTYYLTAKFNSGSFKGFEQFLYIRTPTGADISIQPMDKKSPSPEFKTQKKYIKAVEQYMEAGNEVVALTTTGGLNCQDMRRERVKAEFSRFQRPPTQRRNNNCYSRGTGTPETKSRLIQASSSIPGHDDSPDAPIYEMVSKNPGSRGVFEVPDSHKLFTYLNLLKIEERKKYFIAQ
jgi:hypothetical protein